MLALVDLYLCIHRILLHYLICIYVSLYFYFFVAIIYLNKKKYNDTYFDQIVKKYVMLHKYISTKANMHY